MEDMEAALAYLAAQPDVTIMGTPATLTEGPAKGLTYVYFRAPWGLQLELSHWPKGMPYEAGTEARLYGPATSWEERTA